MKRAMKTCSIPGCPHLTRGRYCAFHQQQAEQHYDRQRGTPAERGYDAQWRKVRAAFIKANPTCWMCGEPATDVDHILPIRDGGTHDPSNLRSFCHRHHSQHTARYGGGFGNRRRG